MKKIIFLILMFLFLIGCSNTYKDNSFRLTKVESHKNGCRYVVENWNDDRSNSTYDLFAFADSCDKFRVGDTLTLIKK